MRTDLRRMILKVSWKVKMQPFETKWRATLAVFEALCFAHLQN